MTNTLDVVLIVDDTPANLGVLSNYLEQANFDVRIATSAKTALARIAYSPPDIILLDILMPEIDGFETCRRLKANKKTKDIPVIFMTALSDTVDELKGFQLGAVDYITKPIQMEIVLARIQTHLSFRKMQKHLQTKNLHLQKEINARKQAENAWRQSEEKLRRFMDSATDNFMLFDADLNLIDINIKALETLALNKKEALGKNVVDLVPDIEKTDRYAKYLQVLETGKPVFIDSFASLPKFGEMYLSVRAFKVGNGLGIISTDITERKKAEEAVKQANHNLEARIEELATLNYITQTVATITDMQTILKVAFQAMTRFFNVDGIILSLFNHNKTKSKIFANYLANTPDLNLIGHNFPVEPDNLFYQILETGQSSIISEQENNHLLKLARHIFQFQEIQSLLNIPLKVRAETIGGLIIITPQSNRQFTTDEIRLAETIAGQIAGAIETAHLFEKEQQQRRIAESLREDAIAANIALSKANQRMKDELVLAQTIQYSLLPLPQPKWPNLDVICYTIPASTVGGDFYDYHAFNKHRYALAVGDISGKGVSAALLMAASLAQFDATLSQNFSPAERLNYLDTAIKPYTEPRSQNCAMCYLEIVLSPPDDKKEKTPKSTPLSENKTIKPNFPLIAELHIVNAGCIPPYIKRVDGSVEWIEIGGFALGQGLGAMIGYEQVIFPLAKGDMIISVSDGVIEAKNPSKQLFGFECMRQLVQDGPQFGAEAMLEHLKQNIFTFMDKAEQDDDITIIVIQL